MKRKRRYTTEELEEGNFKTVLIKPLPRVWAGHPGLKDSGLLHECDVNAYGSLYAKCLVFKRRRDMVRFWNTFMVGSYMSRINMKTAAVTHSLSNVVVGFDKNGDTVDARVERDPRYFGVVAFTLDTLRVGIMTHECVHLALMYNERIRKRNPWAKAAKHNKDELICYPAGKIMAHLVNELRKVKLA